MAASPFRRVIVIVMDSVGIGELPDAAAYGDQGSNTLGNIAQAGAAGAADAPRRSAWAESCALGEGRGSPIRRQSTARLRPDGRGVGRKGFGHRTLGDDGHRARSSRSRRFPTAFPPEIIAEFARQTGRGVLGNKAASGTQIIDELGAEHMRTGALIVYTSADSVFQIAAHEEVVPVPELYRACEIAYRLVGEGLGVGRVIARPFVGAPGHFKRTANRHDYALPPSGETAARSPEGGVGPGRRDWQDRGSVRGPRHHAARFTPSATTTGWIALEEQMAAVDRGFIFTNLVDFDTQYGHRNDVDGYARNLERFDARLARLLPQLRDDDCLVVTADHGNDPTTPSTDHAREYVPLLVTGRAGPRRRRPRHAPHVRRPRPDGGG